MKASVPNIVITQVYQVPKERLWTAITDLEEMRQWYFPNLPAFEPRLGFKTSFNVEAPSRDFLHQWEVTEVEEGKYIAYSWEYPDMEGLAFVSFLLEEVTVDTSKLTLIDHIVEDFPSKYPEFQRESGVEGWTYFIKERLKNYLESSKK